MAGQYQCPLGDQHCEALDKALQAAATAKQLAQDCVDCGLPFEEALNEIKQREDVAAKLKAKFFPGRI